MKLSTAWNWELGVGILEDNVFGLPSSEAPPLSKDLLIEKRRETRISLSLPVRYKQRGKGPAWLPAQSIDVSRNGVRLALDRPLPVGTRVDLDIKLPEIQSRLRLEGVIVWSNPSKNGSLVTECGVAFKNLRHLSHKEKIMYFMADKICALAHRNANHCESRPARSVYDLERAYGLVYREYRTKNYCEENSAKLHYNFFSLLPESRTFLLEKEGTLLGTVSLIPDSPAKLPLDCIFGKEIDALRKPGRKIAEVGFLALDSSRFEKKTFSLTDFQKLTASFRLFKILFDYARLAGGVTDLIIGMHPKHKELYQYLQFQAAGPEKAYPGARGNPALLMHMDIPHTVSSLSVSKGAGSYFLTDCAPIEKLQDCFSWTSSTALDFLINRKRLAETLDGPQRNHLNGCYPGLELSQERCAIPK